MVRVAIAMYSKEYGRGSWKLRPTETKSRPSVKNEQVARLRNAGLDVEGGRDVEAGELLPPSWDSQ